MIAFESKAVRHIVVRLERGEEIHEALRAAARLHRITAAWMSGLGAFEVCELCEYDQVGQRYRAPQRVETPVEILNLTGNLSFKDGEPFAHLHATVSREDGSGGTQILGGHLVAGTVFACELRLDVYDDLVLGRELDADTGLALWPNPERAGTRQVPKGSQPAIETAGPRSKRPSDIPTGVADASKVDASSRSTMSWAAVAAASADPEVAARAAKPTVEVEIPAAVAAPVRERPLSLSERRAKAKAIYEEKKKAEREAFRGRDLGRIAVPEPDPLPQKRKMSEAEYFDEHYPEEGDYVDHKVFGRCRVDGESDSGGLIIRMETGVRKSIRLDRLEVLPPTEQGGHKVFALRPKRPKH